MIPPKAGTDSPAHRAIVHSSDLTARAHSCLARVLASKHRKCADHEYRYYQKETILVGGRIKECLGSLLAGCFVDKMWSATSSIAPATKTINI